MSNSNMAATVSEMGLGLGLGLLMVAPASILHGFRLRGDPGSAITWLFTATKIFILFGILTGWTQLTVKIMKKIILNFV